MALDWFRSYLCDRTIRVKCGIGSTGKIEYSDEFPITFGTPQGSCLGPLIFLIFNNDIHKHLLYCNTILFANDTTLYKTDHNIQFLKKCLENDLILLMDWFRANKLTLNLNKTQCMLFKSKKTCPDIKLEKENVIIGQESHAKFLGLNLGSELNWTPHIN